MSWTIFRATLHQRRTAIFWFAAGLVLYAWVMTWFWPQLGGEDYEQLIEQLPPEMLAIFGGTDVPFASLGGYFQVEYLGLMWMIIVGAAVIIFAGRAFAGEVAAGTMEFVFAQPVSRVRFAVSRIAALVCFIIVLVVASFLPIQIFGPHYGIDLPAEIFWTLLALGTLFMLAVGGIATLLSALTRTPGPGGAVCAGLLLVLWVLDMLANVVESARFFEPVNLVTYWQPGRIINGDAIDPAAWWAYSIVAIATLLGAVIAFSRRDLA